MQVTKINDGNVQLIIKDILSTNEKDYDFLNALWEYVLFSEDVSRTLPMCQICGVNGAFEYEGLGGIKKVGNGMMYIPITAEELYIVPDIFFHYFYSHNAVPTSIFKNAVLHAPKPQTNQYREIIREVHCSNDEHCNTWKSIRCPCCGEIYRGFIGFRISKKRGNVRIFNEKFYHKILYGEKYVEVCLMCLHYSKI